MVDFRPLSRLGLGILWGRKGFFVESNIADLEILDFFRLKRFFLKLEVNIFKNDVLDHIIWVSRQGSKRAERAVEVAQGDVVDLAFGGFVAFEVEELEPRSDVEHAAGSGEGDVLDEDMFVVLWRIGAELEGEHGGISSDFAAACLDIANDGCLTAAGNHAVAIAEHAVFDRDVFHRRAVLILIGERSFAAFHGDIVIIDRNFAFLDRDVLRAIDIDAVGAGAEDVALGRGMDVESFDEDFATAVKVKIPEAGVTKGET